MFKMWKRIEKIFQKMKVKEEEEKRQKAKKDTVDDQRKGDDGDKQKKDGGEDKAKKGDGDKRERKDDDYIAGEELEQQIRAEVDRKRRQEQTTEEDRGRREDLPGNTLEYIQDEDKDDADNAAVKEEVDDNDKPLWKKRLTIMTRMATMMKREKNQSLLISKRRWGHYANGSSCVTHTELKNN